MERLVEQRVGSTTYLDELLRGKRGDPLPLLRQFQETNKLQDPLQRAAVEFLDELGVNPVDSHRKIWEQVYNAAIALSGSLTQVQLQELVTSLAPFVDNRLVRNFLVRLLEHVADPPQRIVEELAAFYKDIEIETPVVTRRKFWQRVPNTFHIDVEIMLARAIHETDYVKDFNLFLGSRSAVELRRLRSANPHLKQMVSFISADRNLAQRALDIFLQSYATTKHPTVAAFASDVMLAADKPMSPIDVEDSCRRFLVEAEEAFGDPRSLPRGSRLAGLLQSWCRLAGAPTEEAATTAAMGCHKLKAFGTKEREEVRKELVVILEEDLKRATQAKRVPKSSNKRKKITPQAIASDVFRDLCNIDEHEFDRLFSVDPSGLPEYSKFVRKPITLRSKCFQSKPARDLFSLWTLVSRMLDNAKKYHSQYLYEESPQILQSVELFRKRCEDLFSRARAKLEGATQTQKLEDAERKEPAPADPVSNLRERGMAVINSLVQHPRRFLTVNEAASQEGIVQACTDIPCPPLQMLMADLYLADTAVIFRWPVPAVTWEYYSRIPAKDCIDLSVLHGKLKYGHYETLLDIKKDMDVMLANAKKYNEKRPDVLKSSKIFEAASSSILDKIEARVKLVAFTTVFFCRPSSLAALVGLSMRLLKRCYQLSLSRSPDTPCLPSQSNVLRYLFRFLDAASLASDLAEFCSSGGVDRAPLTTLYRLFSRPNGLCAVASEIVWMHIQRDLTKLRAKRAKSQPGEGMENKEKLQTQEETTRIDFPPHMRAALATSPAARWLLGAFAAQSVSEPQLLDQLLDGFRGVDALLGDTPVAEPDGEKLADQREGEAKSESSEAVKKSDGAATGHVAEALNHIRTDARMCWTNDSWMVDFIVLPTLVRTAASTGNWSCDDSRGECREKPPLKSLREVLLDDYLVPLLCRAPEACRCLVHDSIARLLKFLHGHRKISQEQTKAYLDLCLSSLETAPIHPSFPSAAAAWDYPGFARARRVYDRIRATPLGFDAEKYRLPPAPALSTLASPGNVLTPSGTPDTGLLASMTPGTPGLTPATGTPGAYDTPTMDASPGPADEIGAAEGSAARPSPPPPPPPLLRDAPASESPPPHHTVEESTRGFGHEAVGRHSSAASNKTGHDHEEATSVEVSNSGPSPKRQKM